MSKRTGIQQFVFSAAFVASPLFAANIGFIEASDQPVLRPATAEQLRPIPDNRPSSVVPVAVTGDSKAGAETSTVDAELQRIFQQNGHPMPEAVVSQISVAQVPEAANTGIELVQHTQPNAQSEIGRKSNRKDDSGKKPGIFKRFFGTFFGQEVEEVRPVGEPAPPIPSPPPIVYQTQQDLNKAKSTGGLNDRAAGNAQFFPSVARTDSNSYGKASTKSDSFINPFTSQVGMRENEVLLDLDSLIEDEIEVAETKQRSATTPQLADAKVEEVPVRSTSANTLVKSVSSSVVTEQQTDAGPYTGFRLDTPKHTYGNSATVAATVVDVVNETVEVESAAQPVIQLPVVSEANKVDREESDFDEIPLLDEPEMQLPVAESQAEEEVPLLDVTQQENTIQTAVAEPLVKIPDPVAEPAPTTTLNVEQPAIPDPQRLKSLEARAQRDQQLYRIMARTGQKGFKGFCPVELRDNRQLIDSRQQYKAKFGLQTYYFSSPEAKSAFDANPARYAPAAGGSDVVLLVNTGEEEAGALDFTLWYRDRLYMFRSRETLDIFSRDPLRYANQY